MLRSVTRYHPPVDLALRPRGPACLAAPRRAGALRVLCRGRGACPGVSADASGREHLYDDVSVGKSTVVLHPWR